MLIVVLFGVVGFVVGLVLQGVMFNFVVGVMLMIFCLYKVGDFIDVVGNFGNVEEIILFIMVLWMFDYQQIIILNGNIWGQQIINYSYYVVCGVELIFGVFYDIDIDKVCDVIFKVFKDYL